MTNSTTTNNDAKLGEEGTGTFLLPGETAGDVTHAEYRKRIERHYQLLHPRDTRTFAAGQAAIRRIKADLLSND